MISTLMPLVDPKVTTPPGAEGLVNTFLGYTMWAGGVTTILSLMVLGIIVVLNAFGRAGDHAEIIVKGLAMVLVGAILVGSASAIGRALVPGV